MFELIVYGNFNIIVMALERLSLIMSDAAYQGIFILVVLLSVLIWGGGVALGRFNGGPTNMWAGLVIILVGICVYMAFINQKGDVVVEEQGLSSPRIAVVPDVPEGVRILMGIYNGVVRTIIPIIRASGNVNTPEAVNYLNNAKGDLFNILRFVFEGTTFVPGAETSGDYLNLTVKNYFADCLLAQVNHPNGRFTLEMFSNGTPIVDIIASGQSPTFETKRYSSAVPQGEWVTCQAAGRQIMDELDAIAANQTSVHGTYHNFWTNRCQKAGYYDPDNNSFDGTVQSCRDKVIAFLATLDPDSNFSDTAVLQTYLVASQINAYLETHNVEALSNYRMATSLKGEGSAAMRWIPILQGAVFATYLGLLPFLALLIPTMISIRILKFTVGIFVFMCCWDICDAVLYGYAIDMAYGSFRELMDNGLSLKMLWMMEGKSYAALLIFSKMRWAAMGLSVALSGIIIQSGAGVLGSLAGAFAAMGGEGQRVGQEVIDPAQRAGAMERFSQSAPTEAIFNKKGFNAMMGQAYYKQRSEVNALEQFLGNFNDNIIKASDVMAETTSQEFTDRAARIALRGHYLEDRSMSDLTASRQGRLAVNSTSVAFNTPENGATQVNPVVNADGDIDAVLRSEQEGYRQVAGAKVERPVEKGQTFHNQDGSPITFNNGTMRYENEVLTVSGTTENGEYATLTLDSATHQILSADFKPYGDFGNFAQYLRDGNLVDAPYDLVKNREKAVTATVGVIGTYYGQQETQGSGANAKVGFSLGVVGGGVGGQYNTNETFNNISRDIREEIIELDSSAEIATVLQEKFDHYTSDETSLRESLKNSGD